MPALWFPVDPRPLAGVWASEQLGGDKLLLAVAPLLASLGLRCPAFWSAESAGLEALLTIPQFNPMLSSGEITRLVQENGAVLGAATESCGLHGAAQPAEVVERFRARGISVLLACVAHGPGLLLETERAAEHLAQELLATADKSRLPASVLLIEAHEPLGAAFGSWLGVKEAVQCLDCRGPADLEETIISLAAEALVISGKASDEAQARTKAALVLASGEARRKLDQLLAAQGASLREFRQRLAVDTLAQVTIDCGTAEEGVVAAVHSGVIGDVLRQLASNGPRGGIDQLAKVGEPFGPGCTMARVHAEDQNSAEQAAERLHEAFSFTEGGLPPQAPRRVLRGRVR